MSRKTKTTATKEEARPALVPKLRFPEFRNAEGWKNNNLGQMGTFIRGLTYTPGDVADSGLLVLRSGNIQDGSIVFDKDLVFVEKACTPDLLLRVGDVVICMSNGSKALVGKSAEYRDGYSGEVTIGAFCSLFRPSNPFSKIAFRSEQYSDFIADSIMGGNINNLKNSTLEGFPFPVPLTKAEQQKIAECLSSVDELIAAQGRKLDALKAHKKGLMQQLFPCEGETQPSRRFPEFQNAGEWVETSLGGVARLRNGYAFKSSKYVDDGHYQIITIANVQQGILAIESTKRIAALPSDIQQHQILCLGDILISMTGNVGRICRVTAEGLLLNQRVGKLIPHAINDAFFYQLLQRDEFRNTMQLKAAGGAQGNLSGGDITEYGFTMPTEPDEQQRIADCLTSLDDLLAAHTQKLEALKTHKKGLMQQLFPVSNS